MTQVHCVPGTTLQQARSDNRQPAKTYLESGVPQKCLTDSYLGGIFMLLKILEEDGEIAFKVDLELGMTLNYLNMSCPDR